MKNTKEITITIEGKEWEDAIEKAFQEANKKDNLNSPMITEIPNGTKIYPAYTTYNYMRI